MDEQHVERMLLDDDEEEDDSQDEEEEEEKEDEKNDKDEKRGKKKSGNKSKAQGSQDEEDDDEEGSRTKKNNENIVTANANAEIDPLTFLIEKICGDKEEDGIKKYYIKYKGLSYHYCKWITENEIKDLTYQCQNRIKRYNQKKEKDFIQGNLP